MSKEMGPFYDLNMFVPVDLRELTTVQRTAALGLLMFQKEKKDGSVKARACADGRKQSETMAEEDPTSPTKSIESLFMTCAIKANKIRNVTIMDLPGALLNAKCNHDFFYEICGLSCRVNGFIIPTYAKNL